MSKNPNTISRIEYFLLITLFPIFAFGITVYPDRSGDYDTIQAAVNAAGYEEVIYLQSGIYQGDGNRDIEINQKISIVGIGEVVIDCESTDAQEHFAFKADEDFILENVNIINSDYAIDAMYCQLKVSNCRFSYNNNAITARSLFGQSQIARSEFNNNSNIFELNDCYNITISRCIVGGLSSSIIKARDCRLRVLNSSFKGCVWAPFNLDEGQYHFIGCIIADNQSTRLDYGIVTSFESDLEFINCVIADNKATKNGSVLKYTPTNGDRARFRNSFLVRNGNPQDSSIIIEERNLEQGESYEVRVNYSVYDDTLSFAGNQACYNFGLYNIEFDDDFMSESSYRPKLDSPAIDSGTAPSDVDFINYDIEENTRVAGSNVDIGVYEYNPDEKSMIASIEEIKVHRQYTEQLPVESFYLRYNLTDTNQYVILFDQQGSWFDVSYRDNQKGLIAINVMPKQNLLYGAYKGSITVKLYYVVTHFPLTPIDFSYPFPGQAKDYMEVVIPYTLLLNREIYMPSECPDLQTAVAKAVDGDTIVVEDGIYSGHKNTLTDFEGKSLRIVSKSNDPKKTAFDFSYQYSFVNAKHSEVEHLYFQGIEFRNSSQDELFFDGRSIRQTTIKNCDFKNITCIFSNYNNPNLNTIRHAFYLLNAQITDCNFESISGIAASGKAHLTDSVFNNCQSPLILYGGSANVKQCKFNNGNGGIGGIWGIFQIEQCSFVGNISEFGSGLVPSNYGSDTQLTQCLFAGNILSGMIIYSDSDLQLNNCTFTNNHIIPNRDYSSLIWLSNSDTKINVSNSIFYNNACNYDIVTADDDDISLSVNYCNIDPSRICTYYWENNEGVFVPITNMGVGNINTDPLFVRNGFWGFENEDDYSTYVWHNGDYHLKSNGWFWNVDYGLWDYHRQTSKCIDAGDPTIELGDELLKLSGSDFWSENIRINMGCYGGTATASIAPIGWQLLSDFNNDGIVNNLDVIHIAENWLEIESFGDISRDGKTDFADLFLLFEQWLTDSNSRAVSN